MVKKGRHRRYEEARQLKRNNAADDIEAIMDRLEDDPFESLVNRSAAEDANGDGSSEDGASTDEIVYDDEEEESPYKDGTPYKR